MASAYAVEPWHEFAVMIGGASAALAGLLIVAMSINIDEILRYPNLPPRAAAALVTMLSPLVVAVLILVPDQSDVVFGVELALLGLALGWVLPGRLARYRRDQGDYTMTQWLVGTGGPMLVVVVSLVLAGVGLATESLGGLYWLALAVLAAILGGSAQAWVLLVEIRR